MMQRNLAAALLVLTVATPAFAQQEAMAFGLPLVLKKGGWARYLSDSPDGAHQVVVRVGATEAVKGVPATWLAFESETPEGLFIVSVLLTGKLCVPSAMVRVRITANGETKEGVREDEESTTGALPTLKVVGKSTQVVGGKKITVLEQQATSGDTSVKFGWSPDVPGTGIARVDGPQQLLLVAFGVGGDPWKDAKKTAELPRRDGP